MKYYEGVLKKVRLLEEKNGIFYARVDGKVYKGMRTVLIAVSLYSLWFNGIAAFFGAYVSMDNLALKGYKSEAVSITVCVPILFLGILLVLLKKHIVGAVITCVPAIVMLLACRVLAKAENPGMAIDGIDPAYYWKHFVPLVAIIITVLWLAGIYIRERLKTRASYIRVTENLYNLYKVNVGKGEEITEEQWEVFLEKYDPFNYKQQFLNIADDEDDENNDEES